VGRKCFLKFSGGIIPVLSGAVWLYVTRKKSCNGDIPLLFNKRIENFKNDGYEKMWMEIKGIR
jgi:hypothetical protein